MSWYDERPWTRLYPPGVGPDHRTVIPTALGLWQRAVAAHPDTVAVSYFDDTLTYAQLDALVHRLAAGLARRGLEPGDRIAILLQNEPQWPLSLLATWRLGGAAVPLNPMLTPNEIAQLLQDSGARVLIVAADLTGRAAPAVASSRVETVVVTARDDLLPGAELPTAAEAPVDIPGRVGLVDLLRSQEGGGTPYEPTPSDVALLTYTSGTTGPPKGAMNTHGNIAYTAQLARDWFRLGRGDVVAGIAPLFHITGLVLHMAVSWAAGAPLALFHRFEAGRALRVFESRGVTFSVAAITAYIALLEHPDLPARDLSRLTKVGSGGAPISPATVTRWEQATGTYIHNIYGLTETTSPSHLTPPGRRGPVDPAFGALSVGVPVPGTVARVVDLDTGREVPPGQPGEITIEGPGVVPGYWGAPEETAYAIRGGRLHTGDVGFMDADGWFYLVDRAKDQINASGYKIWPREVEDVLHRHPAVREAAVVGVPDPYRGETVKAYVALRAGATATPDELIAYCRERLAAFKYPRIVEILDEIPKTATGKFLRRVLRERPAPAPTTGEELP